MHEEISQPQKHIKGFHQVRGLSRAFYVQDADLNAKIQTLSKNALSPPPEGVVGIRYVGTSLRSTRINFGPPT